MIDLFAARDRFGCSIERNRGLEDKWDMKGYYPLIEHFRNSLKIGEYSFENGITIEGKNYAFNAAFNAGTQYSAWAIGLISTTGYSLLSENDVMGSHSTWTEFTSYTEATRPLWGQGTAANKLITNTTPAVFTISATGTLKGGFVTSSNVKGGVAGVLWAHGLFNADVPVAPSDVIRVSYAVAG